MSTIRTEAPLLVGEAPRTRTVLRQIDKVAGGSWPVLILGETGTGKEVVARSIHRASPDGPFVTIDCSSLVGPLMESELFGHARGAFTGAVGTKLGLIELANGGTAFFDEIGELPLDLQAKLLRVIQEKEFRPVGSLSTRRSDFRVVAATNRDLAKEVERGSFRRDLYYRLNVVTIKIAPLRERKEDIALLAQHFLRRYGCNHSLSQEVLDALRAYEWPGNVRELENCVQQMVAINTGPLLHLADLPSAIQNFLMTSKGQSLAMAAGTSNLGIASAIPLKMPQASDYLESSIPIMPLIEMERRAIIRALEHTNGDRGIAANLLGIGRTTLYRKLKEYELAVQSTENLAAPAPLLS